MEIGMENAAGLLETLMGLMTTWGLQVIGAIVVLIVGRWVAGAIRRSVTKALAKANTDESLIPFLSSMAYYVVLTMVIIAVLNLFGIETTSLIAVVGAAGLAIGLALQGTLSNFAAGVMLLVFRPFGKGDVVEAGGVKGSVQEIGIFVTTLNTPDNVKIIIPNSDIGGGTITNYSAYDTRRNDLVIGISYDDNIGKAIEVIQGILSADDRVLKEPAPAIFVADLGGSSVDLAVRPWCASADYWGLRGDLTRKIKEDLEAAGCSIPFSQHDVHMIPPAA
jgi:small conductance mechanosensitive channel